MKVDRYEVVQQPQPKRIVPGQTWTWAFEVGNGQFIVEEVNQKRRSNAWASTIHHTIERGDVLLVMSTRDSGPQLFDSQLHDEGRYEKDVDVGQYKSGLLKQDIYAGDKDTWVTCLFKNKIIWLQRTWFDVCTLVSDV